ncbi:helix-turn-helix domain-containing protein [Chitinibacteraceae bacterium HSL-7]
MNLATDAQYWADDAKIEFAVAIEHRLNKLDISRSELADRLGTSKAYITKMLRGDANLTIESMARIATALDGRLCMMIAGRDNRARWFELVHSTPTSRAPSVPAALWGAPPTSAGDLHVICA